MLPLNPFTPDVGIITAFFAGLASFVSPCVLPLVPAYLISLGVPLSKKSAERLSLRPILNALFFVMGFSLVFTVLGYSVSSVGRFILLHQTIFRRVAGVTIVVLGLSRAGFLSIPVLLRERRLFAASSGGTPFSSFALGAAFSIGWSPCIGPILASILLMAGSEMSGQRGIVLLATYSAGLGIPFILLAVFVNHIGPLLSFVRQRNKLIQTGTGILMVLLGVMVYFGYFGLFSPV